MYPAKHFKAALLLLTVAVLASVARCQLTANEKVDMLQFLNYLRRCTVPRAADMNALFWDTRLETLAQAAANKCVFEHNYSGDYALLGENLYLGASRNMRHILMFMFLERENYDYNTGQCNSQAKYPFFSTCGHYLQMASAGLSKVGGGIQLCSGNYLAVIEFDRPYTNPPYQTGQLGTKCGNAYATYYQDGLCYSIPYGQPTPMPGSFECILSCLNGATLLTSPICTCVCPSFASGVRCERRTSPTVIPNDCAAQAVTCKNGGTPTMVDTVCKCVCPTDFRGENCEENLQQLSASILICFGGDTIYQSYYPVNVKIWSETDLRSKVENSLTNALNNYCSANYAICCPNSNQAVNSLVSAGDFRDSDNYPAQNLDGMMVAAVHYRLSDAVAAVCGGSATAPAFVTKDILTEAWKLAESAIKQIAVQAGLPVVQMK